MKTLSFRDLFEDSQFDFLGSLDDLPVGIYRTSLEGQLVAANSELVRIFGFDSLEELARYPIINLYRDKKDRGALIAILHEKKFVEDMHIAFCRKDGSPIHCAVTARGVFTSDGDLIYIDGIIRDTTLANAEIASISNRYRLQGVQEMAGGIGHHLNQPLMVLNNLISELLADPTMKETSLKALQRAREQVRKLNYIAQKIQNIKHIELMDYVAGVQIVDIEKSS